MAWKSQMRVASGSRWAKPAFVPTRNMKPGVESVLVAGCEVGLPIVMRKRRTNVGPRAEAPAPSARARTLGLGKSRDTFVCMRDINPALTFRHVCG